MKKKPITVEIEIERQGLFVQSSRVYMCETLAEAEKFKAEQVEIAKTIFAQMSDDDWLEIQETNGRMWGAAHHANKTKA